MSQFDDSLSEFFSESDEILQRVSANLGRIESGENSHEILDDLYRDMHTTKGSAQLFGLHDISAVAHAMETCLDPVRRTSTPPNSKLLDALFLCVGLIERLVGDLRTGTSAGSASELIRAPLGRLFQSAAEQFGSDIRIARDVLVPPMTAGSTPAKRPTVPIASPVPAPVEENMKQDKDDGDRKEPQADTGADSTIRVQVGLLDTLMNLVGEMVLVRNQVLQHSSRSEDLNFLNLSQRLDVVTSELQDQVMKTRMQPIGNVLGKFQRLTRDLARDLGKRIDLTLQGKETELDKTLLEAIKDPLTHIVRNSCDHGIEATTERTKIGKPETGHILVRSFHEGGQVIVEVSDDGQGLNRKKIVAKAIERGVMTADAAERLSDREKLNLIFHPGLSTADQVSTVSGRGVGMDVVKTNIERIGGSVELESAEGKGSTVRLRIPLTLAIVPAMLVRSGGDEYAIPQIKLVELVRVEPGENADRQGGVRFVQGRPVYELRGRLLPLVDLKNVLEGQSAPTSDSHSIQSANTINIVVLKAEGDLFGLIVDEVLDTADIVVKPLSKFLKTLELFSAATILGSGRVALILDPAGIAKVSGLTLEKKQAEGDFHASSAHDPRAHANSEESQDYLLFRLGKTEKYALPLCMVNRLEEFQRSNVEFSGKQAVIRYRDSILPLIDVGNVLGLTDGSQPPAETVATVVIQRGGRFYGLVVDEILDVSVIGSMIDDTVKDRAGVLGNLIHGEEVVVVIDALGIIEREAKRFMIDQSDVVKPIAASFNRKIKVLYAEDVAFFRRQVTKLLNDQGFEVVAVEDGRAALAAFKSAKKPFDMVLSDIEMPNMNGFQLARELRQLPEGKRVPLVALTTKFKQRDIDEGMQAGFDSYLEKLNPEVLLGAVRQLLAAEPVAKTNERIA